jgi:hypothetical protein
MKGRTLIKDPTSFPTFELAHRIERGEHRFEVAYGTSFNELYYDFSPKEYFSSADHEELKLQLSRAGVAWLLPVLAGLAEGKLQVSYEQLQSKALRSG